MKEHHKLFTGAIEVERVQKQARDPFTAMRRLDVYQGAISAAHGV
jgi:hypothetical protein